MQDHPCCRKKHLPSSSTCTGCCQIMSTFLPRPHKLLLLWPPVPSFPFRQFIQVPFPSTAFSPAFTGFSGTSGTLSFMSFYCKLWFKKSGRGKPQ